MCLTVCRILEPSQGTIFIDGRDIRSVGLSDLRDKITIIPQIPVLFKGSIRFNLDPDNRSSDSEIKWLLEWAQINKSMDYMVDEKGGNLSSGEKQLICICRAILRKNKIVLMDEATSNIDVATERNI